MIKLSWNLRITTADLSISVQLGCDADKCQVCSNARHKKTPVEGALFGVSVRKESGLATTKEVRDALSEEFAEVTANGLAEGVTGAGTNVGDVGACRGVVLEGRFF